MAIVIGLDFGNYNTFPCFISDFDTGTRMGGIVHDLLPSNQRLVDGIPSAYFYSKRVGRVLVGENAVKDSAIPLQNRLRYLKRHLEETTVLDGKTISYNEAITEVVQHCIRTANTQLSKGWMVTTNLVSLSYPATYTCGQRQRLIELVEKATLEDGRKVKVFGTIAEPAAAALDYLAEFVKSDRDTTVLTYDLGGGTFDLGLVSVYPKGRKNSEGKTYYYDIINTRGLEKIGGAEFDEVMFNLLQNKINVPLNQIITNELRKNAETVKIELSDSTEAFPQIMIGDEYADLHVTRDEFERASFRLLKQTIDETRKLLDEHKNQQPELILLTGGASQMPMVQKEIEKAFPQFKNRIACYRPSRAIAYGAARFGTSESNTDPGVGGAANSIVQQRVMYDIGVKYLDKFGNSYIYTFIKEGTPIPCVSNLEPSSQSKPGRSSRFDVFEARCSSPVNTEITRDYRKIMDVTIEFGKEVPTGHPHEARMTVDKNGVLYIEARDASVPNQSFKRASKKLVNLS